MEQEMDIMKISEKTVSRRRFIISTAKTAGMLSLTGLPASVLAADQAIDDAEIPFIGMTEDGPLYPPVEIPWNDDLTSIANGRAEGKILYLFGRVLSRHGRPLVNATVEIWQTDFNGNYLHPRAWGQDELDPHFGYFGKVTTNSEGYYFFKTIRPRWYSLPPFGGSRRGYIPRAAHIHMKIRHREHGVYTTEAYFDNASHEEIAPKDQVFLSRPKDVRERILLPENSPKDYAGMGFEFDEGSICCRYDLAFLL